MAPSRETVTPAIQPGSRTAVRQRLTEACDALAREADRLDTLQIAVELTQSELHRLESLSLAGLVSSLMGTKAAKLDARREELRSLEQEQKACAEAVKTLTQAVETLNGELAAIADDAPPPASPPSVAGSGACAGRSAHDLERALGAGESLLGELAGLFRACNRLRNGPNPFGGTGALLATAMSVCRDRAAGGLTGQVAQSVRHFRDQVSRLEPGPEFLPEVAVILPRLESYVDPAGLGRSEGVEAWAELEAVTRSIIDDLQNALRRA